MPETFHQPICTECEHNGGPWRGRPHPESGPDLADLQASTHNRIKHDGEDVAGVREFESERVGCLPRDQPEVEA